MQSCCDVQRISPLAVADGLVSLALRWEVFLIVTGQCKLLLYPFVVQWNELEGSFVEGLHQVEVRPHLHRLELLPGISVQPNVVVKGRKLLLLLVLLRIQ